MNEELRDDRLEDIEALSDFLDSKFKVFGIRIGWDAIIGLIPGVGDFATTALSGYIILRAAMAGVSVSVILRMIFNVLVDNVIDLVPFLGWIGDFAWKSNQKNMALIRGFRTDPARTKRGSAVLLFGVLAFGLALVLSVATLAGLATFWLFQTLFQSVG